MQQKQAKFTRMLGQLIAFAYAHNFELTVGEAYRPEREAAADGFEQSLHTLRLAMDFNLFIAGVYQPTTKAYLPLGIYWESLGGAWGGRFAKPDGNHFSLAHEGVR